MFHSIFHSTIPFHVYSSPAIRDTRKQHLIKSCLWLTDCSDMTSLLSHHTILWHLNYWILFSRLGTLLLISIVTSSGNYVPLETWAKGTCTHSNPSQPQPHPIVSEITTVRLSNQQILIQIENKISRGAFKKKKKAYLWENKKERNGPPSSNQVHTRASPDIPCAQHPGPNPIHFPYSTFLSATNLHSKQITTTCNCMYFSCSHFMQVCHNSHTYSIVSFQYTYSEVSDQWTLAQIENWLKCQKWSHYYR